MQQSEIPPTCIIKFTAKWCGPCQNPQLKDAVKLFAQKYKVKVIELDVDDYGDIASEYDCKGIPLFIVMKDGNEIERCVGFSSNLEDMFSKIEKKNENQIVLPISKKAEIHNGEAGD